MDPDKKTEVTRQISVNLPTRYGDFLLTAYQDEHQMEHLAVTKGKWDEQTPVLVRLHSSCLTGDLFGSLRCDCGDQLGHALEMINEEGVGAVVYLNQEGRGIGLLNKLKAYKLQEEGLDTVEANERLGFDADMRDHSIGVAILYDLGIKRLRLLTNNPKKSEAVEKYGLELVENVPIQCPSNKHNDKYLETKKTKLGHHL